MSVDVIPRLKRAVGEGKWSAEGDNSQRPCFNTVCPANTFRTGTCDEGSGVGYQCEACVACGAGDV